MDEQKNLIPAVYAEGSFEAINPFDKIVNPDLYYKVEAIRTVPEMLAKGEDLYTLLFKPIGVTEQDYPEVLDRATSMNAVVVVLTSRGNPNVYVISNYIKSYPLVDGVKYERMAYVVDLMACPPSLKDVLVQGQEDIRDYVLNTFGVESTVRLATIPTSGYVKKEQADLFEVQRKNKITNSDNNVARVRELEGEVATWQTYARELEQQLAALAASTPTEPTANTSTSENKT